ncbi:MAG: FAD-dependent oxidoreductase [Clostridia bacterium]|nr:FAD-dependent oxidoreductase [Clostridia bacterium]
MTDIVVIGGGTAGLTAAIYARRAGKSVLIIEGESIGGQIAFSPKVENYPGIMSISGAEFTDALLEQALALGAELTFERVTAIEGLTVVTEDGRHDAGAIIIASGVKHRHLEIENEDVSGVSYCAVCDGAFYKDKTVALVGGGSTALTSAELLSGLCKKVYLIHRRDVFRAEASLVERVKARSNVEFIVPATVSEIKGKDELCGVVLNTPNGSRSLEIEGLFVTVGQIPQNAPFASAVALDSDGYVIAGEDCRTSAPHIYAAGDCRTKTVRQLTTAAADGSVAVMSALADME